VTAAPAGEGRGDGLLQHLRALSLPLALLAGAIALVYLPALGASFQFDDWNVIVRDPRVQTLAAWLASMPGTRPLLKLSFALNHELGGGVAGFRLFNLLVHAANSLLVGALLRAFGLRLALAPRVAGFAALVGATLFALHPVQTEAVTYVSGRSTSLSTLFALLALAAWLRGLDTPDERRWRLLSCGVFALALGVKEAPVALPLVMAAWLLATGAARSIPRRLAPHLGLLLVAGLVLLAWPPYRAVLMASLEARPMGLNLLTQVNAVVYLLGQLLRLDGMNADPALAAVVAPDAALWLRAALLLALAGAGLWLLRSRPAAGFAILWFFAWLLPTNSLVPRLDVVNDRQLYLALVGPAWLLGLALAPLAERRPRLALLGLAVLGVVLALATAGHNRVYATEVAFWEDVARKSPGNARAANNLGYAYALACRDADALREFRRSQRLDPADYRAAINLRLLSEGALFTDNARHCPPAPGPGRAPAASP
jgi:protein O-mannosyl-transferase